MGRAKGGKQHKYTSEQLEFIRENIKNMSWKTLTPKFNEMYCANLDYKALAATGKRYGIKSGRTGRFPKGHAPWNRGLKGISTGSEKTQFKKGNLPHNWVPIGTERITKNGYREVKIQEGHFQRNWKKKHVMIWEQKHGRPVPPGHVVIFGDRNPCNFDPDNLILVSRAQLAFLNKNRLIQKNNADLTKTGILIADIYKKIGERKKQSGEVNE